MCAWLLQVTCYYHYFVCMARIFVQCAPPILLGKLRKKIGGALLGRFQILGRLNLKNGFKMFLARENFQKLLKKWEKDF